jgi:hypothetical protein
MTPRAAISRSARESGIGHETVMAAQSPHVCCPGQRGRNLLGMSISHFVKGFGVRRETGKE